ncbi:hypothetical protein CDO52_26905 [Nocardiopsis gilva YIM 90087]|uniref:Uncharacterized protein n=1 Tax=Nocardiopsis gilva YIM 90087 TaxID=1235441 RepID=A0A223SD45_9ACTN|nr:hypothetical protein [Nocardiopsis gilva]ASU81392.1 hypothetical protein CDO52_00105 [Nocardiopsis gilva YIM 90087]ASU85939.1 hypothetical protein CDO52_26905 [Nocardiopsis gilva YIM 90087]
MTTVPRSYYRAEPTPADERRLRAAYGMVRQADSILVDIVDHLRDPDLINPDTGDHPLTPSGRRLMAVWGEVKELARRLEGAIDDEEATR